MSSQPDIPIGDVFALDPSRLAASAVKGLRGAFALSGAVALVLGTGAVKAAVGIFSYGLSAALRTLDILMGLLLMIAGIVAIKNSAATGEALLIFTVIIIGVGWIIEGIVAMVEAGNTASRTWAILFGGLSVIAGIVVLAVPGWTAAWLLLVSAIALIVLGLTGIARSFTFGRVPVARR
ncbi:hypothetical protein B5P43_33940 [Bacillus sp. SRB_336]|nr:hypothetical protein B5P43_33940 [Bacillus sp. SRB_336]